MYLHCGTSSAALFRRMGMVVTLLLVVTGVSLLSMAGEVLATSEEYGGFRMNTTGPVVVKSRVDAEAMSGWPITFRAGETVTAIAPDGERIGLVATAASQDGAVAFLPDYGGSPTPMARLRYWAWPGESSAPAGHWIPTWGRP